MVQNGGLVQTNMGLNQNHRLCGPLIVWEITENDYNFANCVPNGGGSPLRHEEDRGGSIVFSCVYETGGYEIWTLVSMASY